MYINSSDFPNKYRETDDYSISLTEIKHTEYCLREHNGSSVGTACAQCTEAVTSPQRPSV